MEEREVSKRGQHGLLPHSHGYILGDGMFYILSPFLMHRLSRELLGSWHFPWSQCIKFIARIHMIYIDKLGWGRNTLILDFEELYLFLRKN